MAAIQWQLAQPPRKLPETAPREPDAARLARRPIRRWFLATRPAFLLLAPIAVGIALLIRGGMPLLWLGLAGLVLGWAYSALPLALNRRGLGELTVAIGFWALIPVGADRLQRGWMQPCPSGPAEVLR